MNETFLRQLSETLLLLRQGESLRHVSEYQDWGLDIIKSVVRFDSAAWASGSELSGTAVPVVHHVHLHKQSQELPALWKAQVERGADIHTKLMSNAGTSVVFPYSELSLRPTYKAFGEKYGISHILSTYLYDSVSGLYTGLPLYRADPSAAFSERDRLTHQFLAPHLLDSWRNCQIRHLARESANALDHFGESAAVVDSKGTLHLAQPGFTSLLLDEWPSWRGPQIPPECHVGIEDKNRHDHVGQLIAVSSEPMQHDVFLLRARRRTAFDGLTGREQQVVLLHSRGKPHKAIARELGISAETSRGHMSSALKKLGMSSKEKLIPLLDRWSRGTT